MTTTFKIEIDNIRMRLTWEGETQALRDYLISQKYVCIDDVIMKEREKINLVQKKLDALEFQSTIINAFSFHSTENFSYTEEIVREFVANFSELEDTRDKAHTHVTGYWMPLYHIAWKHTSNSSCYLSKNPRYVWF